jgi:hypothetical protein
MLCIRYNCDTIQNKRIQSSQDSKGALGLKAASNLLRSGFEISDEEDNQKK